MEPSALNRLVASAEAWLKRRRRASEERRRDQSCWEWWFKSGVENSGKWGYVHSIRGGGPPGLLARCGRVPFERVLASCSSSGHRENVVIARCLIHHERKDTHDEGMKVCLGPFTCEISLGSSLGIGYIFGQERS
jgi:hypothetical protein